MIVCDIGNAAAMVEPICLRIFQEFTT